MGKYTETAFSTKGSWTLTQAQELPEKGPEKQEISLDENSQRTLRFKLLKTVCLVFTWICMGLYSGITGPTVPDFAERLTVDYDSVGFAIAFRSVGKMFGSLTCGYLRDRFSSHGDLLLATTLIVVSVSVVVKPWVWTITVLAIMYSLEGFCHGGINSVGNSMLVLMWKENAALPVHLLHFGYGVGALIVPLIANPFLSEHVTRNVTITNNWTDFEDVLNRSSDYSFTGKDFGQLSVNSSRTGIYNQTYGNLTFNETFKTETFVTEESRIEIPYGIVAGIVCAMGVIYVCLFVSKPARKLTTLVGRTSYASPCEAPFLKDRPCSAILIIALFFLYYMMTSAIDRALGSFLFTYAVESGIGFTKSEASYLNTAFFACYAAGRVTIGLIALKLPVKIILFCEVYMMTVCSAIITFYAYNNRILLWVFSCLLAFFFGPIFPSGVAWVDRYVALYGLVVAIFDVGNGVGAFTANWMSGYLISHLGPHSLLYFTFSAAGILCIVIVLAQIIGSKRGDRHNKKEEVSDPEKKDST